MKKYLLIPVLLLMIASTSFAQTGTPPPAKEKPPTKKEMDEMMKEAQKEMDQLSPEDKKEMEKMGIKMPSFKDVPKVNDKQLAAAWENETLIVPKRNTMRIAAIPKKVNDAGMKDYLAAIQKKVSPLLSPDVKITGEKVNSYIGANSKNPGEAGNMASALWIAGKQELALFVMGNFCIADPSNTDNLSNYASMLSMLGAQHLAIPLLNNLNLKYPKNSTLLNNLGQAWFGLGEISTAEKYLDSAIRIYAFHPQANLSKAAIEESRGNKTEAINLIKKSIIHSYSQEKEERLRKLGHKLTGKEVSLPKNPKADPLNLGGSAPPPFPKSIDECIALEPEWKSFRQRLKNEAAMLRNQATEAMKTAFDMDQKRIKEVISSGGASALVPIHASAAGLKLKEVTDEHDRKFTELMTKVTGFFTQSGPSLKEQYDKEMEQLRKADNEQTGEGMPNKDFCHMYKAAGDKYIRAYNGQMEPFFEETLVIQKTYLNEAIHWQMYAEWPERFEASKMLAKASWLEALTAETTSFISITNLRCASPPLAKAGKLSQFEDVACSYNDTLDLKVIVFYQNCSRMTSKLNLKFAEYTRYDNFNRSEGDTYVGSTIIISAEKGFDELKTEYGPLKLEAKIGAAIEMEFDREGVKDVNLLVEAKVGAGHNVLDLDSKDVKDMNLPVASILGKDVIDNTVEIGVKGRISLVSGKVSVNGTGLLENIL